jgi:hypothetical protein
MTVKKKRKRPLSPKQEIYFRLLSKGVPQSKAWREAGYNTRQSAYAGTVNLRRRIQNALFECGLTPEGLVAKHLLPALSATHKEFAKFEGKITDERELVNWTARLKAIEIVKDIGGYSAPREHELAGKDGAPLTMPKIIDTAGMRSKQGNV